MTIARVDKNCSLDIKKGGFSSFPAAFYFNHIWDYKALPSKDTNTRGQAWEMILFDLRTLQAQLAMQLKAKKDTNTVEEGSKALEKFTAAMNALNQFPKKTRVLKGF